MEAITSVVAAAVTGVAVARTKGILDKAINESWGKLKKLVRAWAGDQEDDVESAMENVIAAPEDSTRIDQLKKVLDSLKTDPTDELRSVAQKLQKELGSAGINIGTWNQSGKYVSGFGDIHVTEVHNQGKAADPK